MKTFYDKEEFNPEDIIALIESEVEESIYLEFKEAEALEKTDSKRKEISKDVAAFANSDGGIIIYGIKEVNHTADSFSFINGNIFTKEWLEQTINSNVQRHIPGLKIFPIRIEGNILKTIYIVKVPQSSEAPHLCKDKRFYKRFNFESVAMDEYEIRQLYERKVTTKLAIGTWSITRIKSDNENNIVLKCEVSVANIGNKPENNYKTNLYFTNLEKEVQISWPESKSNYDYTILKEHRVKLSAVGTVPIFPDEEVNAIRFNIQVPKENYKELLDKIYVEILLFYSGGDEKMTTNLLGITDKIDEKTS